MIEAILFDMGGVLVSEREGRAQLFEYDQMLGLAPGTLHSRLFSGPAWEAVSTGAIEIETYWEEVGAPFERDLPAEFGCYRDNFYGAPLDPAMAGLARRLRSHYRLGLLSNATVLLTQRLRDEPDLHELFDSVVVSALVGMRKPDPAIYHLACQQIELPPAACLLIDDKARNTVAARGEGLWAIEHRSAADTARQLRELGVRLD